jgi:hypothetical protein
VAKLADYLLRHRRLPFGWVAVLTQPAWAPAIALLATAIWPSRSGYAPTRLGVSTEIDSKAPIRRHPGRPARAACGDRERSGFTQTTR